MLAPDKDIPVLGLDRSILHCSALLFTMSQFIGMRRRANLIYRLIPVFRPIVHFGSGAASCIDIGSVRGLFGLRDRRCGIVGIARSWCSAIGLQELGRHFRHVVGRP